MFAETKIQNNMVWVIVIILWVICGVLIAEKDRKDKLCINMLEYLSIVVWLWPFIILQRIEF